MKTIKTENQEILRACRDLAESRKLKSKAEKLEKFSKGFIDEELLKNRIDVSKLGIGETVIIKVRGKDGGFTDSIRVSVKPNNRIDIKLLSVKYPNVEKDVRKDFACVYYDVLDNVGEDQTDLESVIADLQKRKTELETSIKSLGGLVQIK